MAESQTTLDLMARWLWDKFRMSYADRYSANDDFDDLVARESSFVDTLREDAGEALDAIYQEQTP